VGGVLQIELLVPELLAIAARDILTLSRGYADLDVSRVSFQCVRRSPGALLTPTISSSSCGTDKRAYRGETEQYAGTPNQTEHHVYRLICGHDLLARWPDGPCQPDLEQGLRKQAVATRCNAPPMRDSGRRS
jgi:hypothetical protein